MKLCDFGLCRSVTSRTRQTESDYYVATRWYRAPEILLGSSLCVAGIDMWATGCIICEMYHGKPVLPGRSTADQLGRIGDLLGAPTAADLGAIGVCEDALPPALRPAAMPPPPRPFAPAFLTGTDASQALGLVRALLRFDPRSRLPAESALEDAWVQEFHRSEEEPHYPEGPVHLPIDDDVLFSPADYRDQITFDVAKRTRRDSGRRIHSRLEIGTCVEEKHETSPTPNSANAHHHPVQTAAGPHPPQPPPHDASGPGDPQYPVETAALASLGI